MGTKKVLTSLLVIALLAAPAMSVMAQGDGPVEAEQIGRASCRERV